MSLLLNTIIKLENGESEVCTLTGERFGKLTAIELVGKTKYGVALWRCKCDCGNEIVVQAGNLKNGHTKSCGCYRVEFCKQNFTKHGLEHTRLYGIWCDMKARCYDTAHKSHQRYGGRGITVCDEWKDDVQAFYSWAVANGYCDGLTIDRVDNEGDYCPENCRWATVKDQANNRRTNINITYKGETKNMKQWAIDVGIPYSVVWQRMQKLGWSAERALTEPVKERKWKK